MIENLPGKPDAPLAEPAGRRGGRDLGEVVKGLERDRAVPADVAPQPPRGRGRRRRWDEKPIHLNTGHTVDLVRASAEIMGAYPRDAGEVGFMARLLVQATLPHSRPSAREFVRSNGALTVRMVATKEGVGLPYGTYPRLLLAWVTTEAARTKTPSLDLGHSLSAFMAQLGLQVTGGRKGTITVLRRQIDMLFRAAVSWSYRGDGHGLDSQIFPFKARELWWDPRRPEQDDLFRSRLVLTQEFFEELVRHPVPLDMRALRHLAAMRSPLALDLYTWLTYRMSYLREPTEIPWAALQMQFGADYGRERKFREKFLEKLKVVKELYPTARVAPAEGGLTLWPSPTHVPARVAGQIIDVTPPR